MALANDEPITLFIIWSRFVNSENFSYQSTGSNIKIYVNISDLVYLVKVFYKLCFDTHLRIYGSVNFNSLENVLVSDNFNLSML